MHGEQPVQLLALQARQVRIAAVGVVADEDVAGLQVQVGLEGLSDISGVQR
jgi:hypothetical protein